MGRFIFDNPRLWPEREKGRSEKRKKRKREREKEKKRKREKEKKRKKRDIFVALKNILGAFSFLYFFG